MSSKKRRKKRKSREAKRSGARFQKREVLTPIGCLTSKESPSAKSGHAKEISLLIAKGKVKKAVNMAKQYHKNLGTKESEAILVEAYVARILEMTEKGLTVEADTLLDLVRKRYHLPDQRLAEINAATAAREGIKDAFLAPLNDPSIPTEQQAAIRKVIKRELVDLNILTACKTLSPDHPLKVEAAAVSRAFEAVTSRPVDDKEIALPGISRKSPLAPWKMLIKALSCFYRHDDALCERYLGAVEADSAPARLVPAVRAMVSGKTGVGLGVSAHSLVEQVGGNRTEIRKKLQDLERWLVEGKSNKLSYAIRDTVAVCKRFCPEIVERLKQHISIRFWMIEADEKTIKKAMGGPALKNAYFWSLFARAAEIKGKGFLACALLYLAKSAEKRSAFKKCLTYLDEAGQIDGLNPEVKKIRLRMLVATAIRHLKQKKAHLAKKDFKEMEALPLFRAGDRPAFLTALRSVCAIIEGDKGELGRLKNKLIRLMESQLSATMVLQELLKLCGLPEGASDLSLTPKKELKHDALLFAVARGCLLGDDVGVPVAIPSVYERDIEEAFATNVPALNASMMGAIGEAALRGNLPELAYAVSGAGLLEDNAASAGFLLLRARSLPSWEGSRKNSCIDAAIALARRERDMDLIDEAIELRRDEKEHRFFSPSWDRRMAGKDLSADPEGIKGVLTREREAREYPTSGFGPHFEDFDDDDEYDDHDFDRCRHCDIEDCPDRIAEYVPDLDDDPDDDRDDDEWDDGDIKLFEALFNNGSLDLPPDIPPEAMPLLLEMALKYGDKEGGLPDPDELFEKDPELAEKLFKIFFDAEAKGNFHDFGSGRLPGSGRGSKKKRRKKKGQR